MSLLVLLDFLVAFNAGPPLWDGIWRHCSTVALIFPGGENSDDAGGESYLTLWMLACGGRCCLGFGGLKSSILFIY